MKAVNKDDFRVAKTERPIGPESSLADNNVDGSRNNGGTLAFISLVYFPFQCPIGVWPTFLMHRDPL